MTLRIILSEAELFVVDLDHLRQIWGYTKEADDFVETIFQVGGYKCVHFIGITIKPNTEEVLGTVNFMDNTILISNQLFKYMKCFSCQVTSVRWEGPAIP